MRRAAQYTLPDSNKSAHPTHMTFDNTDRQKEQYNSEDYVSNRTILNFSEKNIKEIDTLEIKEGVIVLNLSKNHIVDVSELPKSLERLNLNENKIASFPKNIGSVRNLRVLDLSKNRLVNLDGIQNCVHLSELYLGNNSLNDSQLRHLVSLTELEVLDLSHNNLRDSKSWTLIESLLKLRILFNNMNEYSTITFKKPSLMLEHIQLNDNNLTNIEFSSPKISVISVSLKNNQLSQIKGLANLQSLQNLHCDNNQLTSIESLQQLINVKQITANTNRLTSFNPPQSNTIEVIDLSSNQLSNFDFLAICPYIKELKISNNKIRHFPDCPSYFINLIALDLSQNGIKVLSGLERFPNLTELNLSYNSLSNLPSALKEISKLKALKNLDLRQNNFNADFNFDSLLPPDQPLKSVEILEKALQSAQESLFVDFIKYRGTILSSSSRTLSVLDHIEISDYEMSLAQRYITVALNTVENFSPERSGQFDPNRSNSFEAHPSRYGVNPHRSSISHNRFSASEEDSLFINQQQSDSKLQNPLRSHVKRESLDRLRTGSTFIPDQSPPRSNFLQSIEHSSQDQNSFRSPYQPQKGPYLQNEVTTSAYGKYSYNREPQRLIQNMYRPQNIPRESLKSQRNPSRRSQSQAFSPQRENNWIQKELSHVPLDDSEDRLSEFDSVKFEQERQRDWSNLNRSIEMSQTMIENLGKHKDTTLKEIRNVDNSKTQSKKSLIVEEKLASKGLSSRPSEMNPTYRTDSSFVNEITQEIKKTYDQNLKDLKSKLQQSLKKRKAGDRSSSVSKAVTKESPEKRSNQVYDLIEKFVDKETSYEREDPHERSTVSRHHHRDHHREKDHHHHRHKERSKSKHNIKESEEPSIHKSSHHTKPHHHHKTRTQSVGRVHHDEIASSSHHRSHKEGRRSSQSRTSYNPSRDSVMSELAHGRDSIMRQIQGSKEIHSGFMKNLDNFLMEKLIQRLDNDKKLSSNPYYQLYKDMLVEKHQINPSITITNRTPERPSDNPSYAGTPPERMQQQSRHSPSKFYRKDEDQRKNSTADDIINTTQASNPKNKNTQQMREYSPNKEFEEELDISPRETVNSKKPTITPQKNPYLNSTQSVKMETKDSLFKSPFVTEEKPRNTESDIAIRLRSREDTFPNQLLNPQQSNKQQDLVDSLRFSNYDGDQDPFEIALDLFRKNLPANTNFIDCSCIGAILIEFFKELQIEVSDKTAWGIINEITDFIPRKVTEKSFMDLLILPQIKTLLSQFNIILNSNPPRLGRLSTHNLRAGGNQLISTDKKNSSLHSFSVISSSGISPREEKSRNSHHHLLQSRESTGNLSNKLMIDTGLANKFDKNPTLKDHNDSFASILNTSYQTSSHEPGSQKAGYFHSLTSSNTSCTNKTTSEEVEFLHSYTVMKWEDVYGKELSELFGQLLPYAVTPPKPIVDKEINSSLRKEIPTSSSEYMLLSRILDQFDYRLRKAVKGYNYSQHKRLEKVIEEKNLLRPIQYQYGPMEMKGKKLRHLEDPTLLALKQENSLQFYNWVLLFHAAKIDKLSELIENPNGFKEIYKHRPGNLIFSHNTELCVRRYKRFIKKLEKKKASKSIMDNSFVDAVQKQPKWRLLVSQVYLGNCYLEKEMHFKDFAQSGEIRVLELLKDGYTSIYFEKNEMYLVLLAENCVPVYLCEYEFDETQ